jgi:hypothetical protein
MSEAGFQLFNLETMSGVFPGTRTQVFQRVRLAPLPGNGGAPCWAQILWYDDPPACVVSLQSERGASAPAAPLLRIPDPGAGDLMARLDAGLRAAGWQVQSCGSCAHLRPAGAQTPDGLHAGTCALRRAGSAAEDAPGLLALQGELALACPHWLDAGGRASGVEGARQLLPVAPLPKAAEVSESKMKPWARWRVRLSRRLRPPPSLPAAERLLERSGVGAGTEPCFACQGRIANLAALAVESDEGDKQTFSVWRCRNCYTLYLNDWVDRWERTDSLETEETVYRVAPVEAAEFLAVIDSVAGGDHPGKRAERSAERAWFLAAVASRAPLSRIVKQGR